MTQSEDPRQQVVDAVRMLERVGVIDFNGHCSLRREDGSILINSGRSVRCALEVSDVVAIDLDGRRLEGGDAPPLEFHLHAEIYRKRADVRAIVHGHPKWSTLFTMTGRKIEAVFPQGTLLGEMPVFDSPLSVNSKAMGEQVAACLGSARAALLKSHGAVIVGESLVEASVLGIYLEENASRQYLAEQLGTAYVFSGEEADACRKNLWKPNLFQKAWDYFIAKYEL